MKKIVLLIMASVSLGGSFAQTTPKDTSWKAGGFIGINFSQVNLSQWVPGGENNMALASNVNLFANYAKDKTIWSNNLELAYSILKTASQNNARKSDDRIDLTSKYGYQIGEGKWYYAALLNFKSQFTNGYYYPDDSNVISKFMSPAYLTLALGVTYKPSEFFEVFLSPATGKWTIVNDQVLSDAGAYGVDSGKKVRSEFGAYLNAKFKKEIMTNVTLMSRLELFNNYTDKDKENAKKVDVNWEVQLMFKVNKFITASINTMTVYDANQIERTQFKEVVGVGFGYKF